MSGGGGGKRPISERSLASGSFVPSPTGTGKTLDAVAAAAKEAAEGTIAFTGSGFTGSGFTGSRPISIQSHSGAVGAMEGLPEEIEKSMEGDEQGGEQGGEHGEYGGYIHKQNVNKNVLYKIIYHGDDGGEQVCLYVECTLIVWHVGYGSVG